MATKDSFHKRNVAQFFGPGQQYAWAEFTAAAVLDQNTVNYGGFAGLTDAVLAVNRTSVGVYTLDLTDLPSSAQVEVGFEGDVAGRVTAVRSGRTITVRLYNGMPG